MPDDRFIAQSELNRLVQQLHDLRTALLPFAKFARALPPIVPGEPRVTDEGAIFTTSAYGESFIITCTDLRRALDLLTQLEEGDQRRLIAHVERKALGAGDNCLHCHGPLVDSGQLALAGFCSRACQNAVAEKTYRSLKEKEAV